ncbi:hypothetical protein DSECCO2_640610 [anaerobic digester metagenome]
MVHQYLELADPDPGLTLFDQGRQSGVACDSLSVPAQENSSPHSVRFTQTDAEMIGDRCNAFSYVRNGSRLAQRITLMLQPKADLFGCALPVEVFFFPTGLELTQCLPPWLSPNAWILCHCFRELCADFARNGTQGMRQELDQTVDIHGRPQLGKDEGQKLERWPKGTQFLKVRARQVVHRQRIRESICLRGNQKCILGRTAEKRA